MITRTDLRKMRSTVKGGRRKELEDKFERLWYSVCRFPMTREHKFHPTRKWRFDVAFISSRVAVEIQGGGFVKSSTNYHGSGLGMEKDYEKWLAATDLGWIVVPLTGRMINFNNLSAIARLINRRLTAGERIVVVSGTSVESAAG